MGTPNGLEMSRPASSWNLCWTRFAAAGRVGSIELLGGRSHFRGLAFGRELVQGHGGADECFQCLLVYLLALVDVDGAPDVAVKAGVEEA